MNELIKVTTNDNDEQLVSGRELHGFLGIKTPYSKWFERMTEYGFNQNIDFVVTDKFVPNSNGGRQTQIDHALKLDMAKEVSMIQRNEKGKQARQYFLEVEKAWNNPDMIIKRAMDLQARKIISLETEVTELKPKALFADAVDASKTSILIGDLAKLISQNGYKIGQNRLFGWLRSNTLSIADKIDNDIIAAASTTTQSVTAGAAGATLTLAFLQAAIDLFGDEEYQSMVLVTSSANATALRDAWITAHPSADVTANIQIKGAFASILGVDIIRSEKSSVGKGFLVKITADPETEETEPAFRILMKRGVQIETDRDIIHKSTVITADEHYGAYLYDPTKVVKFADA